MQYTAKLYHLILSQKVYPKMNDENKSSHRRSTVATIQHLPSYEIMCRCTKTANNKAI